MHDSIIGILKWARVHQETGEILGQTYWTEQQAESAYPHFANCAIVQVLVRYADGAPQKISPLKTKVADPDPNAKPAGIDDIASLASTWGSSKFSTPNRPLVNLPIDKEKE